MVGLYCQCSLLLHLFVFVDRPLHQVQFRVVFVMQRLASVLVQIIMHNLQVVDRLCFSRCNRDLFAAADTAFAWQYASVRIPVSPNTADPRLLLTSTRLLRHARTVIEIIEHVDDERIVSGACAMALLNTLTTSVHHQPWELDASRCCSISSEEWEAILSLERMQRLTSLTLYSPMGARQHAVSRSMMLKICALPLLHTLRVFPGSHSAADAPFWTLLPTAPSLTSLSVKDIVDVFVDVCLRDTVGPRLLDSVVQCTNLIHLTLCSPDLYGSNFRTFFTSPTMCRLISLKLDSFHVSPFACETDGFEYVCAADFITALSALDMLEKLHLVRCPHMDGIIPHLQCAQMLRKLVIEQVRSDSIRSAPSASLLLSLLMRCPLLHLHLRDSVLSSWKACYIPYLYFAITDAHPGLEHRVHSDTSQSINHS